MKQKEKKIFGGIFSKGGLYDDVKTEVKLEPIVNKINGDEFDIEEIKEPEEEAMKDE